MLGRIVVMTLGNWLCCLRISMGWTVKSLYEVVNSRENMVMSSLQEEHIKLNTTVIRRKRLQLLLQAFFQEQTAQGMPPKGLEQAFAAKLLISPSLLSQIKKSRPIGDKLARQIERMCGEPSGWLDQDGVELDGADPSEDEFLALARQAWRQANAREKRALRRQMQVAADG